MKLKYSFCAGLAALLLALPSCGNGSLKDITKPYLGEYECESARIGDRELTDEFSFIRLELKRGGEFTLYYSPKNGVKGEESGTYVYDEKEQTLCLTYENNGVFKRKFPLKNGEISVTLPIGSQTLSMKFTRK